MVYGVVLALQTKRNVLCKFICDALMITMIDELTNCIVYTDIMKRTSRPNFQR